jgi:hypothetical protein
MTAPSSQKLADALKAAGFAGLAMRAGQDEFHDYLSPHALPEIELDMLLVSVISDDNFSERARLAAHHIRQRLHDGEFDATLAESDEWAASADGQAAFAQLAKDAKR